MNLPRAYTCSPSWTPLPPPSQYHPSGSSQCTSPKDPVSNLDWRFVSYIILYMFPCHSPNSSHLLSLPQSPKDCSMHLCLFCCLAQGYHYHISKFHIYVLVYTVLGFSGGSEVKVSVCNTGDPGSIPGLGRSPGEGNGNPLQYPCPENLMDRGTWWITVHGVAKSRARLSD